MKSFLSIAITLFSFTIVHAQNKPNIIMLVVDDFNDWTGSLGHNQAITPNIDKLAAEGLLFKDAHASANFCTPSRTSIMTGLLPQNSGHYENQVYLHNLPDLISLPEQFKNNGYKVVGGGKVYHHMPGYVDLDAYDEYFHWNPEEKKHGWGYFAWGNKQRSGNAPLPDPYPLGKVAQETGWTELDHWAVPNEQEDELADTITFKWAQKFLEKKHDKPFFLTVGSYTPHKPNYAPQRFFDLYPIDSIQTPEYPKGDLDDLPPNLQKRIKARSNKIHNTILKHNEWATMVQGYLACLSYADDLIGKVLNTLDKSPYRDNTIVLLWSDNGYHLGEKGWWAKHTMWNRTTHIPFVWKGPRIPKGATHDYPVSLCDTYKTLLDITNIPEPTSHKLDGESLKPIFETPNSSQNRIVTTSGRHMEFTAVSAKWRFTKYQDDEIELYDRLNDPNEYNNLAKKPEYFSTIQTMSKHIPQNPEPQALSHKKIRLIKEGETFRWALKKKP